MQDLSGRIGHFRQSDFVVLFSLQLKAGDSPLQV
jgi:hypothetical protein